MEPVLLKPEEAARALGLGRSKIYQLLATGALPSLTIGRSRRIHRDALESFIQRLRQESEQAEEARE
jgi:excisionase family DNA binding protein